MASWHLGHLHFEGKLSCRAYSLSADTTAIEQKAQPLLVALVTLDVAYAQSNGTAIRRDHEPKPSTIVGALAGRAQLALTMLQRQEPSQAWFCMNVHFPIKNDEVTRQMIAERLAFLQQTPKRKARDVVLIPLTEHNV
jgi:hypothetical protein